MMVKPVHEPREAAAEAVGLEANYCTPEINTSEIIVDFQWHFPVACRWQCPTEFHFSVVLSKGLSLVQWVFTGSVHWNFRGIIQWNFTFVISFV